MADTPAFQLVPTNSIGWLDNYSLVKTKHCIEVAYPKHFGFLMRIQGYLAAIYSN